MLKKINHIMQIGSKNQNFLLLFLMLFVGSLQISFAQHKTRADRFFTKGDYINAAIAFR